MTFAIIKTVQRIGFDETSVIVGYVDSYAEADYVIYRLAVSSQYGKVERGFHAVFSVAKI